jgi:hypothetical protein
MPRVAKPAFVVAAICALLCIAAYILFAIYLETHRPRFPEGLNCWPVKAVGLVFTTRDESVLNHGLKYTAFVVALMAVALDVLRTRR